MNRTKPFQQRVGCYHRPRIQPAIVFIVLGSAICVPGTIWAVPDPPSVEAAKNAANAAEAARQAADQARQAARETQRAIGEARQEQRVMDNVDKAEKAAETADAKSEQAAQKAREAGSEMKKAAAAQQEGKTDDAKAAAEKAGKLAGEAENLSKDAEKAAREAKQQADAAETNRKNFGLPENGGNQPPDQEKREKLNSQEDNAKGLEGNNAEKSKTAKNQKKAARDTQSRETEKFENEEEKEPQRKPEEQPLYVPFDFPQSFFDVFIQLPNHRVLQFPNENSPSSVPDVDGLPGDRGKLRLLLFNDNPFDVPITGVSGYLFGDATFFTPFTDLQSVPAGGSLWTTLGTIDFGGSNGAFTAAGFSILTDPSHPALGPEFAANFTTTPEPSTLVLASIGLVSVLGHACLRRKTKVQQPGVVP